MDLSAELYHAVTENNVKDLETLLENGANPNEFYHDMANISSKHILHICAGKGHVECAKLLVENGAIVLARDNWWMTPILYAVMSQRPDVIDYLLTECAEAADAGDKFGKRPLHYAVEYDSIECLVSLLNHGAYVDSRTDYGLTPLMALCSTCNLENRVEMMDMLLKAGAELELRETGSLRTALQYAVMKKNLRDVETLLRAGADPNTIDAAGKPPITNVVECIKQHQDIDIDILSIIVILIQSGANLNLVEGDCNPLIVATSAGALDIMQLLLDNGANPDVHDSLGSTPLLSAISCSAIDAVRLLLCYNCNMYIKSLSPLTPTAQNVNVDSLELAIILQQWEIADLLILAGYDLSLVHYVTDSDSTGNASSVFASCHLQTYANRIKELSSSPMTLFKQSCIRIRKLLKTCPQHKVESLPLPHSMKDILLLRNQIKCRCDAL